MPHSALIPTTAPLCPHDQAVCIGPSPKTLNLRHDAKVIAVLMLQQVVNASAMIRSLLSKLSGGFDPRGSDDAFDVTPALLQKGEDHKWLDKTGQRVCGCMSRAENEIVSSFHVS